jgi:hypothetical protein
MRFTNGRACEKEDIWISLVDSAQEDWSFGNR